MTLRKVAFAAALSALSLPAFAGDWMVRVRAVDLAMDAQSSAEVLPKNAINVNDKTIPDFDINYFVNDNLRLELLLTVPQEHDVKVGGAKIGTFKHLPPTFLVNYQFNAGKDFRPYVGAGVNLTLFGSEKMNVGAAKVTLDDHSVGLAVQAGFDYALNKDWVFNVDVKKIQIGTDVKLGGTKIASLDVDPTLVGVGFGYRF